ncbi:NusG domain II-containing protein [Oenococcus sicerae]|uniref:NusG domain II-containing protein n=2 Tax=Oenococcus sicerae TaxID=2203724 RepID=A0AAJ1VMM3_9LACO|nr:NusG domain II-containing protein [Oenococcus sicerae]MDN6899811.1 NusG domain II-containing protein [Oenococcus sicerae]QAS70497.1 NusG domain II-containing protein [Oenococcus sicerae]
MKLSDSLKKYFKMIKPLDFLIVLSLILLSFAPLIIFSYQEQSRQTVGRQIILTAVISHAGKVVRRIQLTDHKGITKYRFTNGEAFNDVVATGKKIKIVEANCPDQICVNHASIDRAGESIVCLPHKLIVEIRSSNGKNTGGLVN